MLRYAARASSDVCLCSLQSSRRADTGTCPLFCFSQCAELQWSGREKIFWALLSYTKKCLFCGIRTIPNIITNYRSIFPPRPANNWWITARSPFAEMRAVLSERTPRVEQNPALLRCGRLLNSSQPEINGQNIRTLRSRS